MEVIRQRNSNKQAILSNVTSRTKMKAEKKTGFVRWSQLVTLKGSFTRPPLGKHTASGEMMVLAGSEGIAAERV